MLAPLLAACRPWGVGHVPAIGLDSADAAPVAGPSDAVRGVDDLWCSADGVAGTWTRDGAPVPSVDGRVAAPDTRAGGRFRCEVPGHAPVELEPAAADTDLLVIVMDDVGREQLAAFGGTRGPPTPAIDALAARGVRFARAWTPPLCSPTRATLVTGRHPSRTGVGDLVQLHVGSSLSREEVTFGRALHVADPPWATGWIGKWHLARDVEPTHPLELGFDTFVGTTGNLDTLADPAHTPRPDDLGYARWERNDEGALSVVEGWVTDRTVQDALDAAASLPRPWALVVAFHGVHEPWDLPPGSPPTPDPRDRVDRMLVDLDRAIGELVAGLDAERTTVVLLSDNGSAAPVAEAPYGRDDAKGTVLEGGIRIPLLIAGPLVRRPGEICDALVQTADVHDTALALAGLDAATVDARLGVIPRDRDSVSLLPYLSDPGRSPLRPTVYTERFWPNAPLAPVLRTSAIRDDRYKVVRRWSAAGDATTFQLFDLGDDVVEGPDLWADPDPQASAARDRLLAALEDLDAAFAADPVAPYPP